MAVGELMMQDGLGNISESPGNTAQRAQWAAVQQVVPRPSVPLLNGSLSLKVGLTLLHSAYVAWLIEFAAAVEAELAEDEREGFGRESRELRQMPRAHVLMFVDVQTRTSLQQDIERCLGIRLSKVRCR